MHALSRKVGQLAEFIVGWKAKFEPGAGQPEPDKRPVIDEHGGLSRWTITVPRYLPLIIVTDEYVELPALALEHADSVARRGRAVAVNLLAATLTAAHPVPLPGRAHERARHRH
jgi:hypothetical protein